MGLIIVDEEHDASFSNMDPSPVSCKGLCYLLCRCFRVRRYCWERATPSVEIYHNALLGKYGLVELTERYGAVKLPEIKIIDTKQIANKEKTK